MAGLLELERARRALVPVDRSRRPAVSRRSPAQGPTFRSITVDGEEIEFSEGFADLHTRVYEEMLAGRGFGIDDARPSIELTHRIRQSAGDAAPATSRIPSRSGPGQAR